MGRIRRDVNMVERSHADDHIADESITSPAQANHRMHVLVPLQTREPAASNFKIADVEESSLAAALDNVTARIQPRAPRPVAVFRSVARSCDAGPTKRVLPEFFLGIRRASRFSTFHG